MRRLTPMLVLALAIALAGCGGDVAGQLVSNEQFRNQVFGAIASHEDLALQAVDKILSSDSLRAKVVDRFLKNDEAAKHVIVRIATNADALDMVMGVAVRDSAMREHVMTLVKGMSMATKGR